MFTTLTKPVKSEVKNSINQAAKHMPHDEKKYDQ